MKSILLTVLTMVISLNYQAATYFTRLATGNWSDTNLWSTTACGGAVAGTIPGPLDDVRICNGATVTLDNTFGCNSLTILSGNLASTLDLAGFTLFTGAVTIQAPTANVNKVINVNTGTLDALSITMSATGGDSRDCIIRISTGTVNVSGSISMPSTFARHHIDFTGNGTVNVGGNVTTLGGFTPFAGCTVRYNGAGNQTCGGAYNYSNLIFSGGGVKTVGGATTASGNVTVQNNIDVTFSSTLGVTGGSDFLVEDLSTILFTGAATLSGDFTTQDAATVTFTANSTIAGNVDIQSASTVICNGTIGVTGNTSFTGATNLSCTGVATFTGNLTFNDPSAVTFTTNASVGGSLNVINTSTINCNGTISVTGNTTLQGATAFNTASTATFAGAINLLGTSQFTPSAATTINVGGNWNNSSANADPFVQGTTRVLFNGNSGTQVISNTSGIENFYQVTINNTSPIKPALQSTCDLDILEDYDHTAGFLDLLGNDFNTAGASTGVQTFTLSGGGLISSIAGSNVSFISSAVNALTVTFANFSLGETTSEELNITLTSENSFFSNSIFYGPMVATKTGTVSNNDTGGGNTFFGPITFNTVVGGERWRMANTNPDIFHNLTVNHDGVSNFILGRQTAGNQYHGTTNLNSSTAGGLFVGRSNVVAGTFSNEFFGPVNITLTLSGNVNFAESDATHIHNCIFNDVVTINSSPTSTGDVRFGSIDFGSTTFQGNGTLASGVIAGATNITLLKTTQTSGLAFTINCTGNGTITCGNASVATTNLFDGPISFTAPTMTVRNSTFDNTVNMNAQSFLFQTSTFNGVALMTKTNGATANSTNGGNIFNDDVTFTHNGSGQWSLGSSPAGDDYNGDVTYLRMNAGTLSMASTNTSTFAGNISTVGSSSNPLIATITTGVAELDGNANQIIMGDIARSPVFGRMRINKTGGDVTLAVPINISSDINLTSGIINTDATNLLIVNNAATRTGGSDASHVNGPMRKVGTNAFEFPVGKGGFWRPISITGPGVATDHFTAEFFNSDPDAVDAVDPAPMDAPIENISDCEYWILDRTNGASNVSVTLSYRPYGANGCSGVTDLANLTIARWNGATWVNHPSTGVGVPSGSITTNAAVTSFSPFALATFSATNPLPIELINFTATPTSTNVLLNWQTASEINNDYFEIERSVDGENFFAIGKVNGAGNSSQLLNYSNVDNNPFVGVSYYRLKQTDFDGAFSYSEVKQVTFTSSDIVRIFPNPAKNEVFVSFSDLSVFNEIVITDLTGKIIIIENTTEKSMISIPLTNLASGVYLVSCKGSGHTITQKLVVE
jgi:hypothetical protein